MILTGKGKTMETVKRSVVVGVGRGRDECSVEGFQDNGTEKT